MLEGWLRSLMSRYLGDILENVDTQEMSLQFSTGVVRMNNVSIKPTFLASLALPLPFPVGFHKATVRELQVSVNWSQIATQPLHVHLEGIHVYADAHIYSEVEGIDSVWLQKQLAMGLHEKAIALAKDEKAILEQANQDNESSTDLSKKSIILARLLSFATTALQFKLVDMHICVRIPSYEKSPGMTIGLILSEVKVETTDSSFNTASFSLLNPKTHKLISIRNFGLYLNLDKHFEDSSQEITKVTPDINLPTTEEVLQQYNEEKRIAHSFQTYNFAIAPVDIEIKSSFNKNTLPKLELKLNFQISPLRIKIEQPVIQETHRLMTIIGERHAQVIKFINDRKPKESDEITSQQKEQYAALYKRTLNAFWLPKLQNEEYKEMIDLEQQMDLDELLKIRHTVTIETKSELGDDKIQSRVEAMSSAASWWERLLGREDIIKENLESTTGPSHILYEEDKAKISRAEEEKVKHDDFEELMVTAADLLDKLTLDLDVTFQLDCIRLELWKASQKDIIDLSSENAQDWMEEVNANEPFNENEREDAPRIPEQFTRSANVLDALLCVDLTGLLVNAHLSPNKDFRFAAGFSFLSVVHFYEERKLASLVEGATATSESREFISMGELPKALDNLDNNHLVEDQGDNNEEELSKQTLALSINFIRNGELQNEKIARMEKEKGPELEIEKFLFGEKVTKEPQHREPEEDPTLEETKSISNRLALASESRTKINIDIYKLHIGFSPVVFELAEFFNPLDSLNSKTGNIGKNKMKSLLAVTEYSTSDESTPSLPALKSINATYTQEVMSEEIVKEMKSEIKQEVKKNDKEVAKSINLSTIAIFAYLSPMSIQVKVRDPIIQLVASPHVSRSAAAYLSCSVDLRVHLNAAENSIVSDLNLSNIQLMACDTNKCDISYIRMPTSKIASIIKPFDITGTIECYPSTAGSELDSATFHNDLSVNIRATPIKVRISSRLFYLCAPILNQLKKAKGKKMPSLDKTSSQSKPEPVTSSKTKEEGHESTANSNSNSFGPIKFANENLRMNLNGIEIKIIDDLCDIDMLLLRLRVGIMSASIKSDAGRRDTVVRIPVGIDSFNSSLQLYEPVLENTNFTITACQMSRTLPPAVSDNVEKSLSQVSSQDHELTQSNVDSSEILRNAIVPTTLSLRADRVMELTVSQRTIQNIVSFATAAISVHDTRLELANTDGYQLLLHAHDEYSIENWTQFDLKFTAFSKSKSHGDKVFYNEENLIHVPPFSSQSFSLSDDIYAKNRVIQWQLNGAQSSIATSLSDLRSQRYCLNWETISNLQQNDSFVHVCTDLTTSLDHKGTRIFRVRSPLGFLNSSDRAVEMKDLDSGKDALLSTPTNAEAETKTKNFIIPSKAMHFFPLTIGNDECTRRSISVRPCPVSILSDQLVLTSATQEASTSAIQIRRPATSLLINTENIPTSVFYWSPPCHLRANAPLFVCSQPSSATSSTTIPSSSAVAEVKKENLDAVTTAAVAASLAQIRASTSTNIESENRSGSPNKSNDSPDFGRIAERVKREIWAVAEKEISEPSPESIELEKNSLRQFCTVMTPSRISSSPQDKSDESSTRIKDAKQKKDKTNKEKTQHDQKAEKELDEMSTGITIRSEEKRPVDKEASSSQAISTTKNETNNEFSNDYGVLVQLIPPLIFENLLPCDITFSILERIDDSNEGVQLRHNSELSRGNKMNVHSVVPSFPLYLSLTIPSYGCKAMSPVLLNPLRLNSDEDEEQTFHITVIDNRNRKLQLNLAVSRHIDTSLHVAVYAEWWLFDLTTLGVNISSDTKLMFPEIKSSQGKEELNETLDSRIPFMFSLNGSESVYIQARTRSEDNQNLWSDSIDLKKIFSGPIQAPLSLGQTKQILKNAGGDTDHFEDQGILDLYCKSSRAVGRFYRTKILTIQPRYFFVNQTGMDIRVHQVGEPSLNSSIIESNQQGELHWSSKKCEKKICLQIDASHNTAVGMEIWHWTCAINPNELGQFDIAVRHCDIENEFRYLRIVTHTQHNSFYIHVREVDEDQLLPYCIRNESSAMIRIRQITEDRSDLKWINILPGQSRYIALESPYEESKIFVEGARHTLINNTEYVKLTELDFDGHDENFGGFGLEDDSYANRPKSEDVFVALKTENATQVLLICDHPISENDLISEKHGDMELSSLSPSQLYENIQEVSKKIETTQRSITQLTAQKDAQAEKLSAAGMVESSRPNELPPTRSYVSVQIICARNIPSRYGSVSFEVSFDRTKSKGRTQVVKNRSRELRFRNNASFLFDATDYRHGVITIKMYTSRFYGLAKDKLIGTTEIYIRDVEDTNSTQKWLTLIKKRDEELFPRGELNIVFRWINEGSGVQAIQLNQVERILHEKRSHLLTLQHRLEELQTELDTKMKLQSNVEFLAENKTPLEPQQNFPIIVLLVQLPGIGISLIDDTPTEVAYISVFGIHTLIHYSEEGTRVQVEVERVQIDDQCEDSLFPVVFSHAPANVTGYPFAQLTFDILPVRDTSVIVIDNSAVRIQEMDVKVDERFIYELLDIVQSVRDYIINRKQDQQFVKHYADLRATDKPSAAKQYFFKLLQVHPLALNITFEAKPGLRNSYFKLGALNPFAWGLSLGGAIIGSLHDAPLKLSGRSIEHMRGDMPVIGNTIFTHYRQDLILQAIKAAGYLDFAAQPFGIVSKIGHGIKDFFVLPVEGAKEGHPMKGLKDGMLAPVKATISAFTLPIGHIGSSVAKGTAAITNDREFIRSEEETSVEPKSVSEGLTKGTEQFGKGISEGIAGVINDPIKGGQQDGAKGAIKGAAKGAVGLVAKPISGIASLFGQGFKGIGHAGESIGEGDPLEVKPVRGRRFISHGHIGPYESGMNKNERNTELWGDSHEFAS